MIKYECSDGSKVSQATIDKRRSDSYKNRYQGYPQVCEGCGAPATCSAHIIPQARCKQLRKTELIWSEENYFPSCYDCNKAIENPKGKEWKDLCNLDNCLTVIMKYDEELYSIFVNNGLLRGDL
jgi:hypothetical protein